MLVGDGFLRTQTTLAGIFGNVKRNMTKKRNLSLDDSWGCAQMRLILWFINATEGRAEKAEPRMSKGAFQRDGIK